MTIMNYLVIAILAYFLVAIEVILDKFLISSKRVSHPVVYAFYSGILTGFVLFMIPLPKFHPIEAMQVIARIASGIIFVYGILSLFFAINKSEASRVMPVVGAIIPIVTFVISGIFFQERLTSWQIWGVLTLIAGGLLISFDIPLKINKKKFFHGFYFSILAGVLLAIEASLFKYFSHSDNFVNVFVWTRFGVVIGALSFLLMPKWRGIIFKSFRGAPHKKAENQMTGFLFVLNKILGGIGSILTKMAISLGSVTIVNALVSTEYVFILLLGLVFSVRFPRIFQEKEDLLNIFQKVFSIIIISLGVVLISLRHRM